VVPAVALVEQAEAGAGGEQHLSRSFGDFQVGGHLIGGTAVAA